MWTDQPLRVASLVFFDLETTGLRPDRGARITEMAVVDQGGVRFDWTSHHEPPCDAVLEDQLLELAAHLEDSVVVGHNLSFDFRFVTYEAERQELGGIDVRFIDTLGLSRKVLPGADSHRLDALLAAVGTQPDREMHTAIGDAIAARTLFWKLVNYDDLTTLSDAGVKRLRWHGG
jgi:DNA polymerase III epsilon subunit-like protein